MSAQLLWIGDTKKKTRNVFKVYINDGELEQIYDWVLQHKDIETGGDLFGLWIDERTAVVQFVLGPGENCRRTVTSFYQDVEYLANAGNYLTSAHGLCNIGQWHSHHKIQLFEPSPGDNTTVWTNMPKLALDRYIVFIANINHDNKVSVRCFLYERKNGHQLPIKGEVEPLEANSPLRLSENVWQNSYKGAEHLNTVKMFNKEINSVRETFSETNIKRSINLAAKNRTVSSNYYGQNETDHTRGIPNQDHNAQQNSKNLRGTHQQHEDYRSSHVVSSTQNIELRNDKDKKLDTKNPHPLTVSRNGRQTTTNIHRDARDTTPAKSLETNGERKQKRFSTVVYESEAEKPESAKKATAEIPRQDCTSTQQPGIDSTIPKPVRKSSIYDNIENEEKERKMDNNGKNDGGVLATDEPGTPTEITQRFDDSLDEENEARKSMFCGLCSRRKTKTNPKGRRRQASNKSIENKEMEIQMNKKEQVDVNGTSGYNMTSYV